MSTPTLETPTQKSLRADQLEIGDMLLNDDGSPDSYVYDAFTDEYGTWLETDDSMGYVSSGQMFQVEYHPYEI